MVAALDAVRMGTMSINQVTLSASSLIYGSRGAGPARLECQTAVGLAASARPNHN